MKLLHSFSATWTPQTAKLGREACQIANTITKTLKTPGNCTPLKEYWHENFVSCPFSYSHCDWWVTHHMWKAPLLKHVAELETFLRRPVAVSALGSAEKRDILSKHCLQRDHTKLWRTHHTQQHVHLSACHGMTLSLGELIGHSRYSRTDDISRPSTPSEETREEVAFRAGKYRLGAFSWVPPCSWNIADAVLRVHIAGAHSGAPFREHWPRVDRTLLCCQQPLSAEVDD